MRVSWMRTFSTNISKQLYYVVIGFNGISGETIRLSESVHK